MQITINRTHGTRLYTLGDLRINGLLTTSTVEDTLSMLPVGEYRLRLTKDKKRRRVIGVFQYATAKPSSNSLQKHFEACGSYISSRKNKSICIGNEIIPGALKQGAAVHNRLFDRIEKAEARNETVQLVISEEGITSGEPIRHWLAPSEHREA